MNLKLRNSRSIADEFFESMMKYEDLRNDVENSILEIATEFKDIDVPCSDLTFDWYDYSFEFKNTELGWKPTSKMLKAWKELGFYQCWVCYTDGTEKHYGL